MRRHPAYERVDDCCNPIGKESGDGIAGLFACPQLWLRLVPFGSQGDQLATITTPTAAANAP